MHSFLISSFIAAILPIHIQSEQTPSPSPSFPCTNVSSQVNKLICASTSLSAMDRELANVFANMRGQPLDQKKLQSDEHAWLSAYKATLAELRDQSLKVASPAAYAETRPFPAPPAILSQA